MTHAEIAQLYCDRLHRRAVDTDVYNCWMLENFQSDDRYVPSATTAVLGGLHGVDEQSAALTVLFYAEEAAVRLWEVRN
jgi:hypothetical protein